MKTIITFLFLISAMCVSAFAQPLLSEFNKAKEIKVLQSTRQDVKRILADYEDEDFDDDPDYKPQFQTFSNKDIKFEMKFSRGDCSRFLEIWNVPEGIIARVTITPKNPITLKDLKFDFSNYKKETEDEESPEEYRFHDENAGIIFEIDEDEIQHIVFYPPKSKTNFLCTNEWTEEFIAGEEQLTDIISKEGCELINQPANVTELNLNKSEIISCGKADKNKKCFGNNRKISVTTEAIDAENDQLVYQYTVSAGKIVGSGFNVVWDLTGVAPGVYTITAGVDDGCGICGETKTRVVKVK